MVNSGGGKGVCTVICTAGKDLCKTNTVVYIAPTHCTYVQVVHSALSIVDFPAPYQNLPKVLRPYPEYSRANSYPWSPFPPRRACPGPGPHSFRTLKRS